MQGRRIMLASVVMVTLLPAWVMAQPEERPPDPDFIFRRPPPLDLPWRDAPQRQQPLPTPTSDPSPYGPPVPYGPSVAVEKPDKKILFGSEKPPVQRHKRERRERGIGDTGYDEYMEYRHEKAVREREQGR